MDPIDIGITAPAVIYPFTIALSAEYMAFPIGVHPIHGCKSRAMIATSDDGASESDGDAYTNDDGIGGSDSDCGGKIIGDDSNRVGDDYCEIHYHNDDCVR